ncbi:MAG TPA: LysM peptidoglycan-binding domain-containing protein [Dysgonamonadaceae bacterium]|nr:LysM peptidoglycan-binding domain-containing protein [Dysgonamonadaceae bacterium]
MISQNQTIKQIGDTNEQPKQENSIIADSAIVAPESFDESIDSLLTNWQIVFSKTDNQCIEGANIVYTDSTYIQRLYSLPTKMELSYNPVVNSYIEMYSKRRRDLVSYMLSLGNYYYPMFEEALDRHGLPLELKYLPVIESALNPIAVSRMGATGLWQFMLRTGQQYDLEINSLVDERRDPYKSTEAAARFLKDLYNIYGDWNLVIAAYNCGPGNVNKAIARSGGKSDYWSIYYRLPRETRGYVPAFIAATYIMNYSNEHHICPQESSNDFMLLDTIHVTDQVHFKQISDILDIPIEDIRRYNPQFKSDIIPGNHKSYALVLPTKNLFAFINKSDEIKNHNKDLYFTHRKQTLTDQYAGTVTDGNVVNTFYKVKKGDTLGGIARRNRTSVGRLQSMNGMRSTKLSIGQRLIVRQTVKPVEVDDERLASSGELKNTYYRVKSGDTLGALARRHGTTVAQLKRMNDMKSASLSIGKNLVVKQERVAPELDKKVEVAKAEVVRNYPKIDKPSVLSSQNIINEYIEKVNEEKLNNLYEVTIL